MRVMLTGGGTGGHTSPAVAIYDELQRRDPRLAAQWVGRRGGIEERVAAGLDIPFRHLPVAGWPRRRSLRRLWVAAKLGVSVVRAALLLRRFRPQLVIGVGGYVSLPLVWTAQRMNIPTVLHEQNRRMGMANRVCAKDATRVFLSFDDTVGAFDREKALVVGNPVRSGFADPPDKAHACAALELDVDVPVVLVCGGSQGARSINEAVANMLPSLEEGEVQLIWMTGRSGVDAARAAAEPARVTIRVLPFIDDMVQACAASDVVVSRAGASSTAELALLGKPSVLIPYPYATDNHQEQNARVFEEAGAAVLMEDSACTGDVLLGALRSLLGNPEKLNQMQQAARGLAKPAAAESIVAEIFQLSFGDS
jgi:UDP-N-acetylglucosamine--N-acetylmuramyl-(pentapeptide) pyrophosphoryl-undecaprenol N-acetylglucosamine transferase